MRLPVCLAVVFTLMQTTPLYAAAAGAEAHLRKYEVPIPTAGLVVICHGFACRYRTPINLSSKDISRLREILDRGRRTARDEINAVAKAVAWFERRVGPLTGTSHRTPRAGPGQAGVRSELDCIDASVNTTTLLLLLESNNLLRHHSVAAPEARGYFIDLRYPHVTAVIENLATGARWAIDPWTKRNGDRPDTLPLERWMSGS